MLNVTCPRKALHDAVQIVSRGVTGRNNQTIQQHIRFEATNGKLNLLATDLETISIETSVDVKIEEEGAVTAPARMLADVLGALPDEDVTIVADESQALQITCAGIRETIRGLSARDFMEFPKIDTLATAKMPQSQLFWVLKQTVFACSRDETRPILTGALIEFTPGSVQVVATDTYRLAMRKVTTEHGMAEPISAIVPARTLAEVVKLLSADSDELVTIEMADNLISFGVGTHIIQARIIEGQFPNYRKVVPESAQHTALVQTVALSAALKRALVIAREDSGRVVFRPLEASVEISVDSQDVGGYSEPVAAELDGTPPDMAFNARYMLDALEIIGTERVRLELSGALNPCMVKGEGIEDYLYVLMPMQIM